ncbi:MAG: DnaJ domain-containing protein, partial [Xanthomonadales bacterium]|nr:DnaJ domain-containing protein [Xanthomonadales bacterium]
MEYKDYYKIMGVGRDADADEIKRAYRKLARKYHPDVSKESNAETRFKEIGEAYEVLKDPEKRAAYDQLGSGWSAGQEFRPPPGWGQGFEFRGSGFGDSEARQFSDFFESLFGGGGFGGFGDLGGGGAVHGFDAPGEDARARVQIDLEDAYRGATRQLRLSQPATGADGRPVTKERTLNVRIPKGVTQGQRIRLAGQGGTGRGRGRTGDLYLEIE